MQFKEFLEHIQYGDCYNLAIGAALRQGDLHEQSEATRQVTTMVRLGLLEMAEKFDVFVGSESVRVSEHYPQILVTDPEYLRFVELDCEGYVLQPYSIQNTDSWDFRKTSLGRFTLNPRWAGKVIQVHYKKAPVTDIKEDTEIPLPLVNALSAYVAMKATGTVGNATPEQTSVYYARFRNAIEDLEDSGYGHLADKPAKNIRDGGFI